MIRAGSPETDALDMGMIDLLQTKRQYGRGSVTPLSKKFQVNSAKKQQHEIVPAVK